ncbi:MAG: hypothetical protein ABEJ48_10530 [Halobacteriales archaeon]
MPRYETAIENSTIYVEADVGRIEVGDLETVLAVVGGPAWTIEYSDWEKEYYDDLDTSDEGLTIDVVDTINAMTMDDAFVEALKAQPREPPVPKAESTTDHDSPEDSAPGRSGEPLSPRLGLFVGRLMENLEYRVR